MMKPRRLLLGSVLTLGVTLPLAVTALLVWDDQPVIRQPSGTMLRLTTVQYGTPRPIVYGPVWKRRLYPLAPFLPPDLVRRVGWQVVDPARLIPPDTLLVGLTYQGAPTVQPPVGELVDRHGCRFRSLDNLPGRSEGASTNLAAYPFFPRREASFRLETYVPGKVRLPTGAFTLSNPVGTQHPVWTPEPLPLTRRDGPVEITLTGAERGWTFWPAKRLAREDEVPFTKLSYRLGARSRDWSPVGVTLRNAAGGAYRFDLGGLPRIPGELFVRGDNLCREEAAYDYEVELSRAGAPGARPDRVQNATIAAAGTRVPTALHLSDGTRLFVQLSERNGRLTVVAIWTPLPGEVGQAWLIDSRGQPQASRRFAPPSGRPLAQSFNWTVPNGTKQVHLRLGVYKSRFVTFRVKPRWLTSLSAR